ncbi:MAG TPA: HAMP domain-containing sensor histidine kinase [Solirubrobacterales bacterium]|nr:HAMP domain-containing sensor histidine kinase [Solirubrobacterales bacterium]
MRLRLPKPRRLPDRLRPRSWPVRWRLAAVSTVLTLAILVVFGVVVGKVASERIRGDFDNEVRSAARTLATEVQVVYTPVGGVLQRAPHISDFLLPDDTAARVFDVNGTYIEGAGRTGSLGKPKIGLFTHDEMRVATDQLSDSSGTATGYLQFGRSLENVDATVHRLWLLIGVGVFVGTLLASLAGLTIANRAMRPISTLTATARQVADTGDPSRHMPEPKANDEVGELTLTLEQMLRSLDAARAEREEAMHRQREFVADASHELRTPLTSVIANLELLQASLQSPEQEENRTIADSALRSSQRMSRLVADLLLLARSDAGRASTHARCDLAEVVLDAAAEATPAIGDRQLRLGDVSPVHIEGSSDELHRLVLNLLDNAGRHTPPGTTIELRLYAEGGDAVLEVADDGPGIQPELREHIFDRFVRGDGSADVAIGPGTGLGLAIVRAVATSHNGTTEAAASKQGGALFRVRLPLADVDGAGVPGVGRLRSSEASEGKIPTYSPAEPSPRRSA